MRDPLYRFKEIWLVDTEYVSRPGERPVPVCLVAWEFRTRRKIRLWQDELGAAPPYPIGPESLFVAYLASAEIGFHLALKWPKPARILDLYVEYRNRYNCLPTIVEQKLDKKDEKRIKKHSLLGALTQFTLDCIGVSEKQEMIDLILGGGPWDEREKLNILAYCEGDVAGLARLLPAMLPRIDVPRALLRGRYMAAVASMEFVGVPIDVELLETFRNRWDEIKQKLVTRIDTQYGVYDGVSFRNNKFERLLATKGIAWPRDRNGQLLLRDKTFREMAKVHPELNPLRELRYSLSQLRLNDLAVGHDGFNRCMLSPFGARSSRNTPSNAKFIFGPAVWLRGLIKPPPGWGTAYIDWEQQEFGIAAAYSGDQNMIDAYNSGDSYLGFAKQAGAIPRGGTKKTHGKERALYKQCVLGIGYGMEEDSLAVRTGKHVLIARSLLRQHREIYWKFWEWSDNQVRRTMFYGLYRTVFGWTYHVAPACCWQTDIKSSVKNPYTPNLRSIRNFPMQAGGAEIMRLAVCLGTENGILICCSIHDAVLIMAPLGRLETDIARMRGYMEQASKIVLRGFRLRTEFKAVLYPDRYMDEDRGREFWETVMSLL